MHYGRNDIQSIEAKTQTFELGKRFIADFKSSMGSCACESILELNIGIPVNLQKARGVELFETRCVDAVKAASDISEKNALVSEIARFGSSFFGGLIFLVMSPHS